MSISKRAGALEYLKDNLWRDREGPLQNIFRLGSYILSLMGWSGVAFLALDKYLSFKYQMGVEDIGKWLDSKLGLGPGDSVEQHHVGQIGQLIDGFLVQAEADNDNITKLAFVGGLLKVIGGGKMIASIVWKIVKFLIVALGLTKLGDLYEEGVSSDIVGDLLGLQQGKSMLEGMMGGEMEQDPSLNPANYGPEGYRG